MPFGYGWENIDPDWITDASEYCEIDGKVWHVDEWHAHIAYEESQAIARYLCTFDDDGKEPSLNQEIVTMPHIVWHRPIDRPAFDEISF